MEWHGFASLHRKSEREEKGWEEGVRGNPRNPEGEKERESMFYDTCHACDAWQRMRDEHR